MCLLEPIFTGGAPNSGGAHDRESPNRRDSQCADGLLNAGARCRNATEMSARLRLSVFIHSLNRCVSFDCSRATVTMV
jgi:hypothetical protein